MMPRDQDNKKVEKYSILCFHSVENLAKRIVIPKLRIKGFKGLLMISIFRCIHSNTIPPPITTDFTVHAEKKCSACVSYPYYVYI